MADSTEPVDGVRVLVVEDEYLVALSLKDALDEIEYRRCGVASTVEEALAAADTERPAVALVDIRLRGGGDGSSLAGTLRERYGIGVNFLSGASDPETRRLAEAARPRGFLPKPCTDDDLAAALNTAIGPGCPD